MKMLTTLAAVMVLAGCVYSQIGTRFDISKIDQLQPGISTEADAEVLLGKPVSVTTNPDNNHQLLVWQYFYGTALATGGGKQLAISFDEHSKMIKVVRQMEL
jgi:hypothetical protein